MRGKLKEEHRQGDTRVVRRFLLLPACLPLDARPPDEARRVYQWLWFEWADIKQEFQASYEMGCRWITLQWQRKRGKADMPEDVHWFVTVSYLGEPRGLLCGADGNGYWEETRHTEEDMLRRLGGFAAILDPVSLPFTEEDTRQITAWLSLAEYSHRLGVAAIPDDLLRVVVERAEQMEDGHVLLG